MLLDLPTPIMIKIIDLFDNQRWAIHLVWEEANLMWTALSARSSYAGKILNNPLGPNYEIQNAQVIPILYWAKPNFISIEFLPLH